MHHSVKTRVPFVAADLFFRLARMRRAWKEIVIWQWWCFHGRYYFYSLKFTLMFISKVNEMQIPT